MRRVLASGSRSVPAKLAGQVSISRGPDELDADSARGVGNRCHDRILGRFARGPSPKAGAVMVLDGYAGPNRAQVAVVRELVDARDIRVDHANWLDDGAIYLNDPVRDVSHDNDWSQVRIYNVKTAAWGGRIYSVQGFIGPDAPGPDAQTMHLAQNPSSVARPGDEIGALIAADSAPADENN